MYIHTYNYRPPQLFVDPLRETNPSEPSIGTHGTAVVSLWSLELSAQIERTGHDCD
jgi:hypothetical protein